MNLDLVALPSVVLLAMTAAGILISQSWRWIIVLLMIQYAGIFILVGISWPFQLALTKLIAGLMAGLILWIALSSLDAKNVTSQDQASQMPQLTSRVEISGRLFRLFAASLVGLVIVSGNSIIVQWLPGLSSEQILGSTTLIGLGLLHLGLTSEPYRVVVGLLTVIAGFEIAYAGIEVSALVQGLLAVVTLGLGLVGAYLELAPSLERVE